MAFNPSLIFHNLSFTTYSINLCDGKEFQREDNENIPYDFLINIYSSMDNPTLGLNLSPSSTSFFYPFNTLILNTQFYFSDSRKSPRKSSFEISSYPSSDVSFLNAKVYKGTKFFQNYVDILRNEAPLFLNFSGKINTNGSNYTELLKNGVFSKDSNFQIKANGSATISTRSEKVGEGEDEQNTP
ncbi:MAG: hypothetical protein AB8H03_23705 [Saprospiraceae bacterium]